MVNKDNQIREGQTNEQQEMYKRILEVLSLKERNSHPKFGELIRTAGLREILLLGRLGDIRNDRYAHYTAMNTTIHNALGSGLPEGCDILFDSAEGESKDYSQEEEYCGPCDWRNIEVYQFMLKPVVIGGGELAEGTFEIGSCVIDSENSRFKVGFGALPLSSSAHLYHAKRDFRYWTYNPISKKFLGIVPYTGREARETDWIPTNSLGFRTGSISVPLKDIVRFDEKITPIRLGELPKDLEDKILEDLNK